MEQQKRIINGIIIIAGLALVWLVYTDQGNSFETVTVEPPTEKSNPVLVDGKVPPKLSEFPMHRAFIDEATCLKCHQEGKTMTFMGQEMFAMKMAHEFREDCTNCHAIPE